MYAQWQQRALEQQPRPRRLGEQLAVELDADAARAGQDVHCVKGVARVRKDALVLLIPGVEAVEVEDHMAAEICVGPAGTRRAP